MNSSKLTLDELSLARLQHNIPRQFKPSAVVVGAPTLADSADRSEGRCWITPRVTDFNCAEETSFKQFDSSIYAFDQVLHDPY